MGGEALVLQEHRAQKRRNGDISLGDKQRGELQKAADVRQNMRRDEFPIVDKAIQEAVLKALEDVRAEITDYHEIGCDVNCTKCKYVACVEPKDVVADLEIIDGKIAEVKKNEKGYY